ncbi:MAG: VOC family protein [Solirubrobacterales bacterium]
MAPDGNIDFTMMISFSSVFVDDQDKAATFYTEKLGFVKKADIPMGDHRWLTVESPEVESGTELVLEPDQHPAARTFKAALMADGIPFTAFAVRDVDAEYARLVEAGVEFVREPFDAGPVRLAVLNDTCGNLIQIAAPTG